MMQRIISHNCDNIAHNIFLSRNIFDHSDLTGVITKTYIYTMRETYVNEIVNAMLVFIQTSRFAVNINKQREIFKKYEFYKYFGNCNDCYNCTKIQLYWINSAKLHIVSHNCMSASMIKDCYTSRWDLNYPAIRALFIDIINAGCDYKIIF